MREISAALVLRLGIAGITVLETLVHLNGVLSAPLVLGCYELPDEIDLLAPVQSADLPSGWNAIPHGHASAAFGGAWLGCCVARPGTAIGGGTPGPQSAGGPAPSSELAPAFARPNSFPARPATHLRAAE